MMRNYYEAHNKVIVYMVVTLIVYGALSVTAAAAAAGKG